MHIKIKCNPKDMNYNIKDFRCGFGELIKIQKRP